MTVVNFSIFVLSSVQYRFDKRITDFAEDKFKREGINLKTGSMVVKINDKEISTKERATGETQSIPYGMIVWSTGIGTRPFIKDFMKQIGQVRPICRTPYSFLIDTCSLLLSLIYRHN